LTLILASLALSFCRRCLGALVKDRFRPTIQAPGPKTNKKTYCRWLTVTVAALLTVCEILSRIEVENRHFAHCILIA